MALCTSASPLNAIPVSIEEFCASLDNESELAKAISSGRLNAIIAVVEKHKMPHTSIHAPNILTRLTYIPEELLHVYECAIAYLTPAWLVETTSNVTLSPFVFNFLLRCYPAEHRATISELLSKLSIASRAYLHILAHASKLTVTISQANVVDLVRHAPRYFHQPLPFLSVKMYHKKLVEAYRVAKTNIEMVKYAGARLFISFHLPEFYVSTCKFLQKMVRHVATLDDSYALTIIGYARWFSIPTAILLKVNLWKSRQDIGKVKELEEALNAANDYSLTKFCRM